MPIILTYFPIFILLFSASRDIEFKATGFQKFLSGEVNLAKHVCRKLGLLDCDEALDDTWLDQIHQSLVWDQDSKKFFEKVETWLQTNEFLGRTKFSVADLVAFSCLKTAPKGQLSKTLTSWLQRCESLFSESKCNGVSLEDRSSDVVDDSPKERLFKFFRDNQIPFDSIEHPEVFTVEAMMPYLKDVQGVVSKNLFLKDKKKGLYLLSARHDSNVNLNELSKQIKAPGGGLRFASEEILYEVLGVKQGCVTAFALINDTAQKVKFLVDANMLASQKVVFHPLVNTASTGISCKDFEKFVKLTGHTIIQVNL